VSAPKISKITIYLSLIITAGLASCVKKKKPNLDSSTKAISKPFNGEILAMELINEPMEFSFLVSHLAGLARENLVPRGLAPAVSASFAACSEVKELPNTHLCMFNYTKLMNLAINRASEFIENNRLFDHEDHFFSTQNSIVKGHDLTNKALSQFRKEFLEQSPKMSVPTGSIGEEVRSGLALEEDFWKGMVQPMLDKKGNSVLLVVAQDGDITSTLNHELLHAQFFLNENIQKLVDSFYFEKVTQKDQDVIVSILSRDYDVIPNEGDSPEIKAQKRQLLVNEFMAYVLMVGGNESKLKDFVLPYREKLMEAFTSAQIKLFLNYFILY
jgi:hypothetical protein